MNFEIMTAANNNLMENHFLLMSMKELLKKQLIEKKEW